MSIAPGSTSHYALLVGTFSYCGMRDPDHVKLYPPYRKGEHMFFCQRLWGMLSPSCSHQEVVTCRQLYTFKGKDGNLWAPQWIGASIYDSILKGPMPQRRTPLPERKKPILTKRKVQRYKMWMKLECPLLITKCKKIFSILITFYEIIKWAGLPSHIVDLQRFLEGAVKSVCISDPSLWDLMYIYRFNPFLDGYCPEKPNTLKNMYLHNSSSYRLGLSVRIKLIYILFQHNYFLRWGGGLLLMFI